MQNHLEVVEGILIRRPQNHLVNDKRIKHILTSRNQNANCAADHDEGEVPVLQAVYGEVLSIGDDGTIKNPNEIDARIANEERQSYPEDLLKDIII